MLSAASVSRAEQSIHRVMIPMRCMHACIHSFIHPSSGVRLQLQRTAFARHHSSQHCAIGGDDYDDGDDDDDDDDDGPLHESFIHSFISFQFHFSADAASASRSAHMLAWGARRPSH